MVQKLKRSKFNAGKVTLAALLAVSVAVVVGGAYLFAGPADAGVPTSRKDTLSTSAPSTAANHTIQFTLPSGEAWQAGETVTLNFDNEFVTTGFSNTDPLDYDIQVAATDEAIVAAGGCGTNDAIEVTTVDTANDVFTFTACSSYTAEAAASTVIIEIGTHATLGGTGNTQITNPAKTGNTECTNNASAGGAAICEVVIGGTAMGAAPNTGSALVAIVEGVQVSATVAESLSFSIAGVAAASCTGDTGTAPVVVDTTTNVPNVSFGTVNDPAKFYIACHMMSISTNATNGYTLTAVANQSLRDSAISQNIPNTSCDASACNTTTGAAWATETNEGFGYGCEDVAGTDCWWSTGTMTTNYRRFACSGNATVCTPDNSQSAVSVMSGTGPTNNNQTRIHYKLTVSGTQQAGTYTNNLTYVATPTF